MQIAAGKARSKVKGRIPVTLVTGFLGSGKTSFINSALRAVELSKSLVVVNEFGEVGLDHKLFTNSNDGVIVLENGCLCCTIRSDLVSTLNSVYHSREAGLLPSFDNVVIETSGLAEPGPILQAFLSEPTLDGLFRVTSVVTLVDSINWESTVISHDEAIRQVAFADRILISKLDLCSNGVEAALRCALARLNPSASIGAVDRNSAVVAKLLTSSVFDAADPKSDPRPWLAISAHAEHAARDRHEDCGQEHDHPFHLHGKAVESFVLFRDDPLSRAELQFLLDGISQNLGPGLLRVKGLVNVAEEPGRPAVIQGAQHLLHTMTWLAAWPDADRRTRVVFITEGIVRDKLKEIIELLDRVSSRTFRARERGRLAQKTALERRAHTKPEE
jgi:G3E family GTPase